jgi:hypothetical protein
MNKLDEKLLILQSIELNEACESLYMSKTLHISSFVEASDQAGLGLNFIFRKTGGSIRLKFHKKRSRDILITFNDEATHTDSHENPFGKPLHSIRTDTLNNTLIIQSFLTELPSVLSIFILEQYNLKGSKSWENLKILANSVIACENKYFKTSVNIRTSNEHEHLIYNYKVCKDSYDESEIATLLETTTLLANE